MKKYIEINNGLGIFTRNEDIEYILTGIKFNILPLKHLSLLRLQQLRVTRLHLLTLQSYPLKRPIMFVFALTKP